MTYRGHIRNWAVVLDEPANLPEGSAVEVNVLASAAQQPVTSLDQFRGELAPGTDDSFGSDFEATVQKWRKEPWRASSEEAPE